MSIYAEGHRLKSALQCLDLFEKFGLQPDLVSYTILIKMYCETKRINEAFDIYRKMKEAKIEADSKVFANLIEGCVKTEHFPTALKLLRLMKAKGESHHFTKP
jgi:pentatricopeptide repeat protein